MTVCPVVSWVCPGWGEDKNVSPIGGRRREQSKNSTHPTVSWVSWVYLYLRVTRKRPRTHPLVIDGISPRTPRTDRTPDIVTHYIEGEQ